MSRLVMWLTSLLVTSLPVTFISGSTSQHFRKYGFVRTHILLTYNQLYRNKHFVIVHLAYSYIHYELLYVYTAVLETKIWIYWFESNSWIYFYIVLNKNFKIYWSEHSCTDPGPEDRCSSWGLNIVPYSCWYTQNAEESVELPILHNRNPCLSVYTVSMIFLIYIYIYIRLKIKPNSVRIRF
jgi:hypothetical protein